MSNGNERKWFLYIEDMIEFCDKVLTYTEDLGKESFINHSLTYDATIRNIELIGEAANKIPKHIRDNNPVIPWRMIIAVRNRFIHGYSQIDPDILWDIIETKIPDLRIQLHKIKENNFS